MIIIDDTYKLDFEEGSVIPISKSNLDVKDLGKRKGDFSNTFTLPNNSTVRTALGFNHDPAASDFYAHTKRIEAKYIDNGALMVDGLLKILEANRATITVQLVGKTLDWKKSVAEHRMNELFLGTQALTYSDIVATWVPGANIVFPLIDLGYYEPQSYGILNNYFVDPDSGTLRHLRIFDVFPAFRLTYLIEKILNSHGFTCDIDSGLNKYYIYSTHLLKEYYTTKLFRASTSDYYGETAIYGSFHYPDSWLVDAPCEEWQNPTGIDKYTVSSAVKMAFTASVTIKATSASGATFTIEIVNYRNSAYTVLETGTITTASGTMQSGSVTIITEFTDLLEGDEINIRWKSETSTVTGLIFAKEFYNMPFQGNISHDEIELSYFMPDWTQLEFLQAIKTCFNLYFNTTGRNVEVLLRSNYLNETIVDLTTKVDVSIEPYVEFYEYKKTIDFKYTKDGNDKQMKDDVANETYNTSNLINEETETLTTKFAATLMGLAPHLGINKQIPRIYSEDLGEQLPFRNIDIVPRILVYEENHVSDVDLLFEDNVVTEIPYFKFHDDILDMGNSLYFNQNKGNGLRLKYYKQDLDIRADGRIYHCWLQLNSVGISNINLRDIYKINDSLFELKEIKEYVNGKSTEFEFLPLKKASIEPITSISLYPISPTDLNRHTRFTDKLTRHVRENIFSETLTNTGTLNNVLNYIQIDTTGGDVVTTIPDCPEGKILTIRKTDKANVATLEMPTGITIEGMSSLDLFETRILKIKLVGTDWKILADHGYFGGVDNYTYFDEDGIQVMAGNAKVYKRKFIDALSMYFAGTYKPDVVKFIDDGASHGVYILAFDDSTTQEAHFIIDIPAEWDFGTIIPYIEWSPGNNTDTGNVRWRIEYTWQDINENVPITTKITVDDAGDGTAYKIQEAKFSAITSIPVIGIHSKMMVRIYRDAADGADDFRGDAYLFGFGLKYQINQLGSKTEDTK